MARFADLLRKTSWAVIIPENKVYMYYKGGNIGDDARAEERLNEWENINDAIKDFVKLFQALTENEY